MADDDRLAALETRLRAAEDHLEIINLLDGARESHDVMRKVIDL